MKNYNSELRNFLTKKHPEIPSLIKLGNDNALKKIANVIVHNLKIKFEEDYKYYASLLDKTQEELKSPRFTHEGLKGIYKVKTDSRPTNLEYIAIYLGYKSFDDFKNKLNVDKKNKLKQIIRTLIGVVIFCVVLFFTYSSFNHFRTLSHNENIETTMPTIVNPEEEKMVSFEPIYGVLLSENGAPVNKATIQFEDRSTLETNALGIFKVSDSLHLYQIYETQQFSFRVQKLGFEINNYVFNEDFIIKNDTISKIILSKKKESKQSGTTININTINNKDNASVHIGSSN